MAVQPTSVELEGMKRAQGSFQTAIDAASGSYTQMEGQIQGLRANWTGQAATIYQNAMQEWLNDFKVVNQQLGVMLEKLQQNTGVYANTHENTQQEAGQLARLISSGHADLPGFPA